MDRKKFLKLGLAGTVASTLPTLTHANKSNKNSNDLERIGYNHLPNKNQTTMNTILHKANTRGAADHGWLKSFHSFSFANYHNPERMHFGVLRVLNDDTVAEGKGFGTHPHRDMEIISIPLEGDLEHKDSMGNNGIIKEGDIQVMSAGTGVEHSEFNSNADKLVKFLQIWIFPRKRGLSPRYDQLKINEIVKPNEFSQILSPSKDDAGVWINQDAWFSMGNFEENQSAKYQIKQQGNGIYAFVIDGEVEINGTKLEKRDGFGIWDINEIDFKSLSKSKVLLMDIPMQLEQI